MYVAGDMPAKATVVSADTKTGITYHGLPFTIGRKTKIQYFTQRSIDGYYATPVSVLTPR